ncbi:MAG TPA: type I-D CRISPR-associated protein Cas10d/Csc3 [Ktedonobacteraceae bacterium]
MVQYHRILREYLDGYAISAMLREGWWFKAAKSYGWKQAARGADFHVDQPLRTHILNGLYALTRTLEYLEKQGYYTLSAVDFKRVLVLYSMHDAYKDSELAHWRVGTSDFDIPLVALNDLLQRMKLGEFVAVKPEDLRAASVALLSPKVADIAACTSGITRLLTLVHLADSFASQQTARDYTTTENRLRELSRDEATRNRNYSRISQRLSEAPVTAEESHPALALYYHELDDYRGLSTLLIHQATEEELAPFGLHPILYFANALLYIGPANIEIDVEKVRTRVATRLFAKIRREAQDESLTVAKLACVYDKGITQFKEYAYLFCSFDTLLKAAVEKIHAPQKATGFLRKKIVSRVDKNKYAQLEEFFNLYELPFTVDQNELQAQQLFAASQLVMATESIAGAMLPGSSADRLLWLCRSFQTPESVVTQIQQNSKRLRDGGIADHCYIIAYHWLVQSRFASNRSWLEVPTAQIKQGGVSRALEVLAPYEREELILAFVEKTLGMQSDAIHYLQTHLQFSSHLSRALLEDPLKEYEKARTKAHKRLCVLCNRFISTTISAKDMQIDTSMAEQSALVFSNRRTPTAENKNDMMVWCPMCYLEFMLRKLSGQGYPEGGDYNASYRLYLYLLPDYSFTPELWTATSQQLLRDFHPRTTTVTRLALRGGKDDPSIPRRWLQYGTVDEEWLERVRAIFAEQAERMKTRGKSGDRLTFSFTNPNYMLLSYANTVSDKADSSLKPTRTEVWAKALYAAILLHLLTGVRVYITDKPYLTFTRPEEMKTIIEMEGVHPLLAGLLPVRYSTDDSSISSRPTESSARLPLAALPALLDLFAAIWEITAALFPGKPGDFRNLDKQVASILEEVKINTLAGATLYKKRERDKTGIYPLFTRACQILLPQGEGRSDAARSTLHEAGYTLMLDQEGETWMNLVQEITNTSLELYLPLTKLEGRAHRYESMFRTGLGVIKGNARMEDAELIAIVAGHILKRLERISGGVCPTSGGVRTETASRFAELLVKQLYSQDCGRSVSKLTHKENALADAIYFFTSQQIGDCWKSWKERQKRQKTPEPTATIAP